jgi:hypothetical protein
MRPAHCLLALLLANIAMAGCGSLRLPFMGGPPFSGTSMTEEELHSEIGGFATRFGGIVGSAAEDISNATDQRSMRKRTLLWRMRMIPAAQAAAFSDPAQEGYLRALGLAIAQRLYLTEGDGRALFGAQQSIAVDAANLLEQDALQIGAQFLSPEGQQQVKAEVEALVRKNPIVGRDFSLQRVQSVSLEVASSPSLMSVLTLPLAPFKALEGVDSGARAIRDFNATANVFSRIVAQMPAQIRAESELLLYDVEDRETVIQSVAAIERMAASAQRASESIERLPADLQKTLAGSHGAIQEANQALLTARDILVPLTLVSENVKLAGDSWAALFPKKRDDEPPGRPFDVREWQSAAAQIGTSADELRALAVEINTLTGGTKLEAAVDHAAWRGAQLVALFFALLVGYRLLAWRLGRTRRDG